MPWWHDGSDRDASGCKHVPYLAGDLYAAFVPSGARYLNDHTLARGPDGTWHLYGITDTSAGNPEAERALLHATAPSLLGPWTEQPDALVAAKSFAEQVLWAPHVLEREPGRFMMFYYADLLRPGSVTSGVRQAESSDLWHWERLAASSDQGSRPPGGRDPFVLRDGARWLLFSVGVDTDLRGQILSSESHDPALRSWSPAVPVVTEPVAANPSWRGDLQSPFVVLYDAQYYLFVTRRSPSPIDYVRTDVLCSSDPRQFAWQPIAELRAHAAEVVVQDGRYFITSAGWPRAIGEEHRGLSLAPLGWASKR